LVEKELILKLIHLKQEGGYWDFKREWYTHSKKADLLHDIICMANNLESRDGYIIIGVDEGQDFSICGINSDRNRKSTANIVDFLREKKFAGGIRPTVSVETIEFDIFEVDVLIIHFDRHTPYYLTENYQGVFGNNIYTRVQDTNTPKNSSADIHHVEALWKRRFGLDANIFDRYLILLDEYDQWEHDFGNLKPAFHKILPEFRIEADELRSGWEPQGAYYLRPEMRFALIKLLYAGTTIYETGIMSVDGGSLYLPYPRRSGFMIFSSFFYDYYVLSELEGKLLKILTSGSLAYDFGMFKIHIHLFLIFHDDEERKRFESFVSEHYREIDTDLLKEHPRVSLALNQARQNGYDEGQILQVAVASELYSMWLQEESDL